MTSHPDSLDFLLAQRGFYHHLYVSQFKGQIVEA